MGDASAREEGCTVTCEMNETDTAPSWRESWRASECRLATHSTAMAASEGPDLACFDFASSGDEQETREDVLKKHLQEEEELRAAAKAKKKAIDKSDKPARRACEAEFAEALERLAARHAKELEDAMAALAGPELSSRKDRGKGKAAQRAAKKAEEEAQRERRIALAKAEPASAIRCRQPGEPAALGDFVDWALEQQELDPPNPNPHPNPYT